MPRDQIRRSPSQWRALVEKWRVSGLSVRKFSEKEGLSCSTLYAIINKYGAGARKEPRPSQAKFVEVAHLMPRLSAPRSSITIKLSGDKQVVVRGVIDAAQLQMVMEVLRSC